MAKLWELIEGLRIAISLNITHLNIELDTFVVVTLVEKDNFNDLLLNPLLIECKRLLEKFPSNLIRHVFREANQCADILTKIG